MTASVNDRSSPTELRRIHDDLRGLLRGELLFDTISRKLYSTDASIFEVEPMGVVLPRDEEDVQALVRYAGENQIHLIPRGAGTGLAGESLGTGLIVDLSTHFRSILEITGDTIRAQPGVTCRELSTALAQHHRRLGPNPSQPECALGGMLATNASGSRAHRFGYVRDYVDAMRVVLDTGDAVTLRPGLRNLTSFADEENSYPPRLVDIHSSIVTLLEQNPDLIEEHQPQTPFNRCGYLLRDVLTTTHLDLPRLLVGSEGTLAITTEATLRTVSLPGGRAGALISYLSLDRALRASGIISAHGPVACDLLDRRLITLARTVTTLPIPNATEAVLLVEIEADTQEQARRSAESLLEDLQGQEPFPLQGLVALEPHEMEQIWQVREGALPGLYRLRGPAQAVPFIEDLAVPTENLAEEIDGLQKLLQQYEITASFLIHVLTGQIHVRPFLEMTDPASFPKLVDLAEDAYRLTLSLGGTISGQHGTGLSRTAWVSQQYGPLYSVLREIKGIFDPRHLFNPGKIIASSAQRTWPLRQRSGKSDREILQHPGATGEEPLCLIWPDGEPQEPARQRLLTESEVCNGCGDCRSSASEHRMCPIFRAERTEAGTPRAKANLLRELLLSEGAAPSVSSTEAREVANLCVNCKMCANECPAHVQIPRMMLEAKAANVAEHGLDRRDWAVARIEGFARFAHQFAPFVNHALSNPLARWTLERLLGISRKRRLPTFAFRSFLQRARRRGWTQRPSDWRKPARLRVAYFVDVFANYNEPEIAEAAVAVLHHNGIEVLVPERQRGCGMASLSVGDVETARDRVQHNLRIFVELAREGYHILCTEPTAALMLRQDALDLLGHDHPDAKLVADQTVEWTSLVWEHLEQGQLRTDFKPLPISVAHHVPCHLKALHPHAHGPELLSLIPGMRVRTMDVSCSGMAGTFGLKASNYDVSLKAGQPMLEQLRRRDVQFGSTECSACKLQMEDGASRRTFHPAQYLALAYGLMPELWTHLKQPIGKRALS